MAARWRGRTAAIACVLGAATVVIGIVPASGAKLKTKSATAEVSVDETGSATAACKQRQKVISGGFEQPDFDPSFAEAGFQFYESRRESRREWTSSAANYGGGASGTLISYAYCRKGKALKETSASVTVPFVAGPEFGAGTVTASCEQGQKVVSGGFDNPDFEINQAELLTYASRKEGRRGWTVSAVNYDDDPGTLTAHAYCRKGKATKTKSQSTKIAFGQEGTATAKCKKGQQLLAGGFDNPDFGPEFASDPQLIPFASMKAGKRKWTASAYGNSSPGSGTFTAYAYCEKKG